MPKDRQHSRDKSWGRSRVAKLALAVCSTFAALAVVELCVRFFFAVPDVKSIHLGSEACAYRRSTNPILGFELKPNYRNDDADNIESYARTNTHGLRDKPRSIAKAPGVVRVLLLGDSVVEGYGLAEHETISHQWEGLYSQDEVEILNFGTSAYCTRAEVELLERKGLRFAPDVVIVLFVENDFDNFNREAFPLGGTMNRPASVDRLFYGSHLFRLVCVRFDLFHYSAEFDPIRWNREAIGDNNVFVGLRRLKELSDQHRFQTLVAIWPRFFDDRVEDTPKLNDDELVVERLAQMHGLRTVRLSDYFRQDVTATKAFNPRLRYTLGDQLHPSAEGCGVAAQAFKKILVELREGRITNTLPEETAQDSDAVELARVLGSDQPHYSRVFNRIGTDLLRKGEYGKAAEQFQRALVEDEKNAGAYNNLGVAYERLGRKDAEDQFKRAILAQPDFAMAHFNLARNLLRKGKRRVALLGFRQVLKIDPNHIEALNVLGRELGKDQQFTDAEPLLKRAVRLNPRHVEAQNNLGVVLAAQGKREAALDHFRAALKENPEHQRAAINLQNTLNALP